MTGVDWAARGRAAYRRCEQPAGILDPAVVEAINALPYGRRQVDGDAILREWTAGWGAAKDAGEPREDPAAAAKPALEITHSHAEGTVLHGSRKGDGAYQALRMVDRNWRYHPTVGIYWRGSRGRRADPYRLDQAKAALEKAGFTVTVEVDNTPRPTAQVEADRAERSEARADALAAKGSRLTAQGEADWERTRELRSHIPLGQPLLTDHHSYKRDRRFRDRLGAKEDRAIDALKAGQSATERAAAAKANQAHHLDGATTERRIKKLEAERRAAVRNAWDTADLDDQLAYWRAHLAALVESGEYRVWGPDDFAPGDLARVSGHWYRVVKVNKKTLTLPSPLGSWTDTVPYDNVSGRRPPAEMQAAQTGPTI